jgi:nitronate monooxygenase
MARWDGREGDLAAAVATEKPAYEAAARSGDCDTAVVWAGAAVDLITGVDGAAAIVERISAEAEATLRSSAALVH